MPTIPKVASKGRCQRWITLLSLDTII